LLTQGGTGSVPLFSGIRLKEIEDGEEFQFDSRPNEATGLRNPWPKTRLRPEIFGRK
jgi:hypothetical protein